MSEARHFELYVGFARAAAAEEWRLRLEELAAREAQLATTTPEGCCAFIPGRRRRGALGHSCLQQRVCRCIIGTVRQSAAPNQLPAVCCTGILNTEGAREAR